MQLSVSESLTWDFCVTQDQQDSLTVDLCVCMDTQMHRNTFYSIL